MQANIKMDFFGNDSSFVENCLENELHVNWFYIIGVPILGYDDIYSLNGLSPSSTFNDSTAIEKLSRYPKD